MDHLYSLYDALVSINIPNDRARSVVDAMERDMYDKLATRTDLQHVSAMLSKDIQALELRIDAKMDMLGAKLTVRLGAMIGAGFTLLFALQNFIS
jgi:hypothetical protein